MLYAKLMRRLSRWLFICRVMVRDLSRAGPPAGALHYRVLTGDELLAHCADAELELSARQVRAAYARGDVCVGALENGVLVGYTWSGFGRAPHVEGIWVEVEVQARYNHKTFVRSAWRGKRIAAGLALAADALCLDRGLHRSISLVETHNRASLRAFGRVGYRAAGIAGYVQICGRLLAFRSPGARRHGVRFC
jgi:GNAT superfamily N-acetyltransferase